MKRIFAVLALIFLSALPASAQQTSGVSQAILGVDIKAQTTNCTVNAACAWLKLPNVAGNVAVTLAGTFSGTITVEQSGDGGNTWSTLATLTGVGVTSYSVNGMTDVRARCSTYVSGTISTTLSVGLLQVQSVVSGSATGGVGTGAAPIMGFYFGPNCLTTNTGNCIYTTADVQIANDCGWTNASTTITCATDHFVATDVGKSVDGFNTCAGDVLASQSVGGEIAPNATPPTITAFLTTKTVTISATPANTKVILATAPVGGCFRWGHIDDAGAVILSAAVAAAPGCPKVFLSAVNYFFTTPPAFMYTNPVSCINIGAELGAGIGNPGFGTTTLPAGYEIEGRGTGNTGVFLTTNFPNGDACTHVPTPGALTPAHTGACFVIPVMGGWNNFRIDGGGQGAPTGLNGKTLIYMAVGKMRDFLCMNYGGYIGGSSVGIELSYLNQLDIVNNSGCGSVGLWIDAGVGGNIGRSVIIESSSFNAMAIFGAPGGIEPNFLCYYCNFAMSNSSTLSPNAVIQNRGGNLKMFGGRIYTFNGNSGANTNNGIVGYLCQTTAGCNLYAESVNFTDGSGGGSNTNGGIQCTVTCDNTLINSTLKSQSASFDYQDVAGSRLFDLGKNTFTPRISLSGKIYGDASITGSPSVTGNWVLTSGWGTSTTGTFTGSTRDGGLTITEAGVPATGAVLTFTFPIPFLVSPTHCGWVETGGTQVLSSVATTSISATAVSYTFAGTLAAGSTIIGYSSCGNN